MNERPPITEFQFYILAVLAQSGDDGLHGYGILQAIESITQSLRKYALPSLYEALRALEARGLIKLDRQEPESGRLRKYFKITGEGERAARDYQAEMERIQKSVRRNAPVLKPANG